MEDPGELQLMVPEKMVAGREWKKYEKERGLGRTDSCGEKRHESDEVAVTR